MGQLLARVNKSAAEQIRISNVIYYTNLKETVLMKSPFTLEYNTPQISLKVFTSAVQEVIDPSQFQFEDQLLQDVPLANIYLFTQQQVYYGKFTSSHLNKDLKWNSKSVDLLCEALSGKKSAMTIKFTTPNDKTGLFRLSCELDSGIGVWLLQMKLTKNDQLDPFEYMLRLFMNERQFIEQKQNKVQEHCRQIKRDIDQIEVQERYTIDNHNFEMLQRKENFLTIINNVKKRIAKRFGNEVIEQAQEEDKNSQIGDRKILKVKRQSLKRSSSVNDQFLDLFQG